MREVRIGDTGEIVTGSTPSTKDEENYGGDFPFVRVSDMKTGGKYVQQTEKTLTNEGKEKVENRILPPNSISVACIGSLGKVSMNRVKLVTNQQINSIVPNKNYDNQYLYYKLLSISDELERYAGGTAQPILSKSKFSDIKIKVHTLEEQKRIGKLLAAIDSKIELNREIAGLLEETAHAIYESWFKAYEPYDEFRETEVGEIPKSFRVSTVAELCENIKNGGTPSRSNDNYWGDSSDTPWIKTEELNGEPIVSVDEYVTSQGLDNSSCKTTSDGSVLVALYGASVGNTGVVTKEMAFNQACCCLNPKEHVGTTFLLLTAKSLRESLRRRSTGAAQQNIKQSTIKNHSIELPPNNQLQDFKSKTEHMYSMMVDMKKENQILEELRDYLLPQLLSGEIVIQNKEDSESGEDEVESN